MPESAVEPRALAVDVRRIAAAEAPAVVDVLTRAFDDDPLANWAIAQDGKRDRRMRLFFDSPVRRLALRHNEIYSTPAIQGAAVWFPPGAYGKSGVRDQAGTLVDMVRCTTLRRFPNVMRAFNLVEKDHPRQPHWYLMALGVEPELQGRSIGTQLLAPVLQRCDAEGMPAYLESSRERNLPLYERNGFTVTRAFPVAEGAPMIWLMWREPR